MSISDLLSMGSEKDRDEFEKLGLGYTETYGLPELREAIADTGIKSPAGLRNCKSSSAAGFLRDSPSTMGITR